MVTFHWTRSILWRNSSLSYYLRHLGFFIRWSSICYSPLPRCCCSPSNLQSPTKVWLFPLWSHFHQNHQFHYSSVWLRLIVLLQLHVYLQICYFMSLSPHLTPFEWRAFALNLNQPLLSLCSSMENIWRNGEI